MYLRTVMKQAYYFSKDNYCDFEEAFQNGVIGLMTAIENMILQVRICSVIFSVVGKAIYAA